MKKITVSLRWIVLFIVLSLPAAGPLTAQETQDVKKTKKEIEEKSKQEDLLKDFHIIDKTQPVPADLAVGFESITARDTKAIVKFLASDLLEGRDTGEHGYDVAAAFAAVLFKAWGLQPAGDIIPPARGSRFPPPEKKNDKKDKKETKKPRSFYQEMAVTEILNRETSMKVACRKGAGLRYRSFGPDVDYRLWSRSSDGIIAPVVFAGYGLREKSIKYDDFKKMDLDGKIVIFISGVPGKDNPESPFRKGKLGKKYFKDGKPTRAGFPNLSLARKKGAVLILIASSDLEKGGMAMQKLARRRVNDEKPIYPGKRRRMVLTDAPPPTRRGAPVAGISRGMANHILGYAGHSVESLMNGIEKKSKPCSFALPGVSLEVSVKQDEKLLAGRSVLAYIEGSDPELKNEVVIIGGHLDHIGRRGDYIFNGADDNASGSAAVLAIARAFAVNKIKPKRSVLFALWTGEEAFYFGSRHYILHPFFPLKKTVAYLNLDMVSREWEWDKFKEWEKFLKAKVPDKQPEHLDLQKFAPMELSKSPKILEAYKKNNVYVGLHLHFRQTDRAGGSDHVPFMQKKIPWITSFGGTTDDYHESSDSTEKINPELMARWAQLTYLAAFSLGNL